MGERDRGARLRPLVGSVVKAAWVFGVGKKVRSDGKMAPVGRPETVCRLAVIGPGVVRAAWTIDNRSQGWNKTGIE